MKAKAALAVALLLAISFAFVAPMDENDGAIEVKADNTVTFDPNYGGTIVLKYVSDETRVATLTITIASSGEVLYEEKVAFKSTGGSTEEILIPLAWTSSKSEVLNFTFAGADIDSFNMTVKFSAGVWGSWTTYAAIAIVILLVVVLVFVRSRTPKAKNTLTFEQIEAMKKAEKETAQPAAKSKAPTTERQRYLASKKKNQ